jgi:hypothetical protein|tara:strand:+ start:186 stop:746 length:561 start_codon:yes stop_codon:yes gene_type:complete
MGCGVSTATQSTATATQATTEPKRESTLDVLLTGRSATPTSITISLPFDVLEDLIVDETFDVEETLQKVQTLVNSHANDITKLFDDCRDGNTVVDCQQFVSWGSSLGADIDEDTAQNQFFGACGYPVEQGGETPQKACDVCLFACCLVRIANLYTIQNKGNPMDSDIPNQLRVFWDEKALDKVASL